VVKILDHEEAEESKIWCKNRRQGRGSRGRPGRGRGGRNRNFNRNNDSSNQFRVF